MTASTRNTRVIVPIIALVTFLFLLSGYQHGQRTTTSSSPEHAIVSNEDDFDETDADEPPMVEERRITKPPTMPRKKNPPPEQTQIRKQRTMSCPVHFPPRESPGMTTVNDAIPKLPASFKFYIHEFKSMLDDGVGESKLPAYLDWQSQFECLLKEFGLADFTHYREILDRTPTFFSSKARLAYAFTDVAYMYGLLRHPNRVKTEREARVRVVPFLPSLSFVLPLECGRPSAQDNTTTHSERMLEMSRRLEFNKLFGGGVKRSECAERKRASGQGGRALTTKRSTY